MKQENEKQERNRSFWVEEVGTYQTTHQLVYQTTPNLQMSLPCFWEIVASDSTQFVQFYVPLNL